MSSRLSGSEGGQAIRPTGVVLGAVLLLVGCGTGSGPDPGAPAAPGSPATGGATTGTAGVVDVQSCAELIEAGWAPPPEEAPDLSWDPATGITYVTFAGEQLVLDIKNDARCPELPVVGGMLRRALQDAGLPEG